MSGKDNQDYFEELQDDIRDTCNKLEKLKNHKRKGNFLDELNKERSDLDGAEISSSRLNIKIDK